MEENVSLFLLKKSKQPDFWSKIYEEVGGVEDTDYSFVRFFHSYGTFSRNTLTYRQKSPLNINLAVEEIRL